MKKSVLSLLALAALTLGACSAPITEATDIASVSQTSGESAIETTPEAAQSAAAPSDPITVEYDDDDLQAAADPADLSTITLQGDAITLDGSGATVDGAKVTITSAGTYDISGKLSDGQIVVDTPEEETVTLILNGAAISCATSAPIYVRNADKVVITLAAGTENLVTDGSTYVLEDVNSDEPNGAIFTNGDLTINGEGSLTVVGNYNHGIVSQDDLKITGGRIDVEAANDGIKGRDSIAIKDGSITVTAGGDGLQSSNDEDSEKGYIIIEGGALTITAAKDGIQAETRLQVDGGVITIVAGGGSVSSRSGGGWGGRGMEGNANQTDESAKGLKAAADVTITAGTIQVSSLDDALHSNDSITISGGSLQLASGDDGVHADTALTISGGEVNITESYEGLESSDITITGGIVHLVSADDGVNAVSATGGGTFGAMRPGGFETGDSSLVISDGYLVIDAGGDGLDINGTITMTDGTVIINGPTNDGNGALDYLGQFSISGGYLVAVGSAGMAEAPSSSSTQYSVIVNLSSPQAAGTVVAIEADDGTEVLAFAPTKQYQSVVFSSPELENGRTYTVYVGGSASGTLTDGVYSGGSYADGTPVTTLTIASMVTGAGATGGMFSGRTGTRPLDGDFGGRPARP